MNTQSIEQKKQNHKKWLETVTIATTDELQKIKSALNHARGQGGTEYGIAYVTKMIVEIDNELFLRTKKGL